MKYLGGTPNKRKYLQKAFTIVELLIVIVVIGILAAIVTVAFNGVSDKATQASAQAALSQIDTKIKSYVVSNGDTAPASLADIGISDTDKITYQYSLDTSSSPQKYCTTVTAGTFKYYIGYNSETEAWVGTPTAGACPEHSGDASKVKQLVTTFEGICVIASDSTPYCWGQGGPQLGIGPDDAYHYGPVKVLMNGNLVGKTAKQIAINGDQGYGVERGCMVASDNLAYCWGKGRFYNLGTGNTDNSSTAIPIQMTGQLAGKTVKSLSLGYYHNCLIASDNLPYCWGINSASQLGDGTSTLRQVASPVQTGALAGKTVKAIAATSVDATCVIASDNLPYCWGNGSYSVPTFADPTNVLNGKTVTALYRDKVKDTESNWYTLGPGAALSLVATTGLPSGVKIDSHAVKGFTLYGYDNVCVVGTDKLPYCMSEGQFIPLPMTGDLAGKTIKSLAVQMNQNVYGIASDGNLYRWTTYSSEPFLNPTP